MKSFGKSAPGKEVADYFDFNSKGMADKILKKLAK